MRSRRPPAHPTPAPATATERTPDRAASGARPTLTVQAGDTLWDLAARRVGDGARWTELYAANEDRIRSPGLLPVGLVLTVPPSWLPASDTATPPTAALDALGTAATSGETGNPSDTAPGVPGPVGSPPDHLGPGSPRVTPGPRRGRPTPDHLGPGSPRVTPGPRRGRPTPDHLGPGSPVPRLQPSGGEPADEVAHAPAVRVPEGVASALPLGRGGTGPAVEAVQERLHHHGADLTIDGVFGPQTELLLRAFEAANGLDIDGELTGVEAAALFDPSAAGIDEARLEGVPGTYVGAYDAYRDGEALGPMDVVIVQGRNGPVKVAAHTARAWQKLRNAAAADGVALQLNSGFRTMAEQEYLFHVKYGPPRAAAPGWSNHQHGQALDIDMVQPDVIAWMNANAATYGWEQTVSFEPWHWEYMGSP